MDEAPGLVSLDERERFVEAREDGRVFDVRPRILQNDGETAQLADVGRILACRQAFPQRLEEPR